MKRTLFISMLFAALFMAACHEERITPDGQQDNSNDTVINDTIVYSDSTIRNVGYVICAAGGHRQIVGDVAWFDLLDWLFDAAVDRCHKAILWDYDYSGDNSQLPKAPITYSTLRRDSAYAWSGLMYDRGYVVSMVYDASGSIYNFTAVPLTTRTPGYDEAPLAGYLPGSWVIDETAYYDFYSSDFRQHPLYYGYENSDTLVFTQDSVYMSILVRRNQEPHQGYTIIDGDNIQISCYDWPCQIVQLNADSIIVKGYDSSLGLTMYDEPVWVFGFLFKRVN